MELTEEEGDQYIVEYLKAKQTPVAGIIQPSDESVPKEIIQPSYNAIYNLYELFGELGSSKTYYELYHSNNFYENNFDELNVEFIPSTVTYLLRLEKGKHVVYIQNKYYKTKFDGTISLPLVVNLKGMFISEPVGNDKCAPILYVILSQNTKKNKNIELHPLNLPEYNPNYLITNVVNLTFENITYKCIVVKTPFNDTWIYTDKQVINNLKLKKFLISKSQVITLTKIREDEASASFLRRMFYPYN